VDEPILVARENFINGISRISHFWGYPKAMGAIYGAIYLSPTPLSLDDLVNQVGVTKGAVSTSVRTLERLNMVHKHLKIGDRKDYYTAETDFWKIIKGVLREREKSEFDIALKSITDSLGMLPGQDNDNDREISDFYRQRMERMRDFFNHLDGIVATLLALDDLRAEGIRTLFGKE